MVQAFEPIQGLGGQAFEVVQALGAGGGQAFEAVQGLGAGGGQAFESIGGHVFEANPGMDGGPLVAGQILEQLGEKLIKVTN